MVIRAVLFAFIRAGEEELLCTQSRPASSFSFWLIYDCYLISQEKAALDASVQLSSYLHQCPFSLQLSSLLFHFPTSIAHMSPYPMHPARQAE